MKIEIAPLYLKDVDLLFGTTVDDVTTYETDDYAHHASAVTLTPATSSSTWQGLSPAATHTAQANTAWTAVIAYAQDWDSAKSLSRYLWENRGAERTVKLTPRSGVGPSWEADVTLVPGPVGGTTNAHATGSVTLGMKGEPRLLPGV